MTSVQRWLAPKTKSRPARGRAAGFRPQAERLEAREVPAINFLQGFAFVDAPGGTAGVYDPTDLPQAGVTMELRDGGGALVAAQVTDADGYYKFATAALAPGNYKVAQAATYGVTVTAADPNTLFGSAAANPDKSVTVTVPNAGPVPLSLTVASEYTTPTKSVSFNLSTGLAGVNTNYEVPFDGYAYQSAIHLNGAGGAKISPTIYTFCVDLLHYSVGTYGVTADSAPVISAAALTSPGTLVPTSEANLGRVAYLYNTYGRFASPKGTTADGLAREAGLALAFWELIYDDGTPAPGDADLGLTTGRFAVNAGTTDPEAFAAARDFLALSAGKSQAAVYLNYEFVNDPALIASAQGGQGFLATELINFANSTLRPPYTPTAELGDFVWDDLNANGVQDTGEPGVAGVTVTLRNEAGVAVDTTVTDAAGKYWFSDLYPATYSVAFSALPAGYTFTGANAGGDAADSDADPLTGGTATYALANGESYPDFDAGIYRPAALGDFVWYDANANGAQDTGEPGIAGVTVTLTGTDGRGATVTRTAVTDANGKYLFAGLVPGSYAVSFPAIAGYTRTAADAAGDAADSDAGPTGATGTYTLQGGDDNRTVDAGYTKTGSITGIKLKDRTGNGLSADDTPLAGTKIYLDANNNKTLDAGELSVVTGADGAFTFANLAGGTYTVREVVGTDFLRTYPALSDNYSVPLAAGAQAAGYTFVNYEKDCGCAIAGLSNVYYDVFTAAGTKRARVTDLRGNVNQGETVRAYFTVPAGAAPAVFTLASYTAPENYFNANTAAQQRVFDLDTGTFGLGTHTLEVVVPGSNFQVDFVCGEAIDVLGPAGSNIFYSAQCRLISADNDGAAVPGTGSSLAGTVYVDRNNNGLRDVGEPGIPGVTVALAGTDYLGGAVAKTAVTAADGTYAFTGLKMSNAAGYTVTETQPAAYGDGKDAVGTAGGVLGNDVVSAVRLGAGTNATGYNFGELGTGSISGYVYVDSDNNGVIEGDEGGIVGAVITLKNAAGAVVATAVTDDDGFYEFTGLAPGTYTVVEAQPFGFFDGKDSLGNLGGTKPANDTLGGIVLGAGAAATNYNFGEIGVSLQCGMTATIGFWNNKSGQDLIKAMPGAALGNWLAANFPNLYAGLAGQSSAQVAAYYKSLFNVSGAKTGAQVLGLAFAVFVTNTGTNTTTAGRNLACQRGFRLSNPGTAAAYVNVGTAGAAFDMDNGTTTTVYQLIRQLDLRSANGVILGAVADTTARAQQLAMVNTLFTKINEWGDI